MLPVFCFNTVKSAFTEMQGTSPFLCFGHVLIKPKYILQDKVQYTAPYMSHVYIHL